MKPLEPCGVARDDRHRALADTELSGDEQDQRGIGGALDRRCREARGEIRVGAGGQRVATAARGDADRDDQAVGDFAPGLNRR